MTLDQKKKEKKASSQALFACDEASITYNY